MNPLARYIARHPLARAAWRSVRNRLTGHRAFEVFQWLGLHVTLKHFHGPVPDTRELGAETWARKSSLVGIDLNLPRQRELLRRFAAKYRSEYDAFAIERTADPTRFFLHNGFYQTVDAELLHCMVREHSPRRIVEVGSGNSTLIISAALRMNRSDGAPNTHYTIIDPFPGARVTTAVPEITRIIGEPVERVPLSIFEELGDGDILFIDSSHILRTGGDVWYAFNEILPRLAAGVFVHVHDIFLPNEYPREWVVGRQYFWTEQYLLQAFLTFNREFEVIWAGRAMHLAYPDELRSAITNYEEETFWPSSFWIRRIT